jgi:hypothetical protein
MRQGPPRRPLATCFRAVGSELQAAVLCECRAVGGAASPWLGAGRVHWWLKGGCRAGTRNETRGWDARPDGVHASREGGCAAQGGPCAAVRLCVWAWRGGCREAKNACHTRAFAAVEAASPPPRARGNPLCVCATQPGAGCGVCVQLARQGRVRGWERREPGATLRGRGGLCRLPIAICVRATAGLRRARALEPKRCASQRNRKFADGGLTSGRKSSNWSSRAKPDEAVRGAGGMRLDRGPSPSRSASAARRARARSKKKRKRRPPEGHRQPRRRTGCTPENPRSSKRHAAPRARAGGHAARSSDCGGEAGGGLGGNGERRWRGRCDVDRCHLAAPGAREGARSGLCRPPPGYFSTSPG